MSIKNLIEENNSNSNCNHLLQKIIKLETELSEKEKQFSKLKKEVLWLRDKFYEFNLKEFQTKKES